MKKSFQNINMHLEQLMCFAGIKPQLDQEREDYSFSSNSDLESSREFMDNLQSLACRALNAVAKLLDAVEDYKKSDSSLTRNTNSNRNIISQWPRNCKEYLEHLKQQGKGRKSQKNSFLQPLSTPCEEKRVRFDVRVTSQSPVSCSGDTDIIDV